MEIVKKYLKFVRKYSLSNHTQVHFCLHHINYIYLGSGWPEGEKWTKNMEEKIPCWRISVGLTLTVTPGSLLQVLHRQLHRLTVEQTFQWRLSEHTPRRPLTAL